jgi:hypothetical protein
MSEQTAALQQDVKRILDEVSDLISLLQKQLPSCPLMREQQTCPVMMN